MALASHPAVVDARHQGAGPVLDYADGAIGAGWHGRVLRQQIRPASPATCGRAALRAV